MQDDVSFSYYMIFIRKKVACIFLLSHTYYNSNTIVLIVIMIHVTEKACLSSVRVPYTLPSIIC